MPARIHSILSNARRSPRALAPRARQSLGVVLVASSMMACSQPAEPERKEPSSQTTSRSSAPATVSASAPAPASAPASASARPAGSADTADLEAKLAADKAYAGIWEAPRRKDLDLLLTAVSQHLTHGGLVGETLGAARAAGLVEAAETLDLIWLRAGQYPDDFMKKLGAHLEAIKGEPRLGLWSAPAEGQPPHDYAALAVLQRAIRKEASYPRELLAARQLGPVRWVVPSRSRAKRFLTTERATLERIEEITQLSLEEQARLAEIKLVGPYLKLYLERLWRELPEDARRAEPRLLRKVGELDGVVVEIGKDNKNKVMLAPVKPKEAARAQCTFDERAAKEAGLTKGAKVRVQARVDAIAEHVVLSSCAVVGKAKDER